MGKRTLLGLLISAGVVLVWVLLRMGPMASGEVPEQGLLSEGASGSYGASSSTLVAPGQREERAGVVPEGREQQPAARKQGPRGRLVLAEGGAGIAGMTLDLSSDEGDFARVTTDMDGHFAFAEVATLNSRVGPQADPRFTYEPTQLRIARLAQASGEEPLIFRANERTEGRVHGRVIDSRTFEGVPSFRLSMRDAIGNTERLRTDPEGYYEGVTQMLPGVLRVGPRDEFASFGRYSSQRLNWDALEEPLEIAVRVGPTYKLNFQAPGGLRVESFYAEVRGRGEACLRIVERDFRSSLRAGQPPWVRLRPGEVTSTNCAEYELVVTSEDGYWVGRAAVQSVVGVHPGVLPVILQGSGILRGRIRGEGGDGRRARIILTRDSKQVVNVMSTNEGSFDIPGLLEGEYVCQLIGVAAEPFSSSVRLLAGETTLASFELQTKPREHALVGRLRTRSGRVSQHAEVVLYDRLGQPWPTRLVALQDRGESFYRVESRRLPAGLYRPVARFGGAEYVSLCEPVEVQAVLAESASEPSFEIVVDDRGGDGTLSVELSNEDTQRSIDGEVYLVGAGWSRFARTSGGYARFRDLPPAPEVWNWYVRAEGFRMASGESTTQAQAGGVDPQLKVGLRPGWGAVVRVLTALGGAPQAGIEVLTDGISQGRTDSSGRILITAAGRPERLSIGTAGWELVSSRDVLAPDGQFRVANWADVIVQVKPRAAER
ncbi:MAG: hypothetical protein ACI8QC_002893 [Planctomycetota bacterium]|jgi:hypothetical protein